MKLIQTEYIRKKKIRKYFRMCKTCNKGKVFDVRTIKDFEKECNECQKKVKIKR